MGTDIVPGALLRFWEEGLVLNSKKLFLQKRSAPKRCAYCHSDFYDGSAVQACESCGLSLHGECKRSLERCPSLGCGQPFTASLGQNHREGLPRLPLSELEALDELARMESRINNQSWVSLWSRARSRASEVAMERGASRWRLMGALGWIWFSFPFFVHRIPSTIFSIQAWILDGDGSHGLIATGMIGLFLSTIAALFFILRELRAVGADSAASATDSLGERPPQPGRFGDWPLAILLLLICGWSSLAHWEIFSQSKDLIAIPMFIVFVVLVPTLGPSTLAAFSDCQSRRDLSLYRNTKRFDQSMQVPSLHAFAAGSSRDRQSFMLQNLFGLRLSLLLPLAFAALLGPPGLAFFLPLMVAWGAELRRLIQPLLSEPVD